jgi:hypothetical protein
MYSPRGNAGSWKLAWIGVFSMLLVMLPILSRAEEKVHQSDIKGRLAEVQKVVGKDWSVTALPDGYLVTYIPLVSFYSAVSESSKLDNHQRAAHGRMDHLRIKIIFGYCLSDEEIKEYSPLGADSPSNDGLKSAPGYFLCNLNTRNEFGGCYVDPSESPVFRIGQPDIWLITNFAPNESVSPEEATNAYVGALWTLGNLFNCISPDAGIED